MLTQREAVSYLLLRNILSPEHIVTGDLAVADISRRHHNYKITNRYGPAYMLKQGVGQDKATSIEREAEVYRRLTSGKQELSGYLPRLYFYDADEHVLLLELIDGAQDLREYHLNRGYFPISLARELGKALGTLHGLMGTGKVGWEDGQPVASPPPFALFVHRPTIRFLQECSAANLQLIKVIQQFPVFCDLLDALRQDWRNETFIHRDIRWDNCLVYGKSSSARKSQLKIVDWELASVGDPCWDVGSVFNDYLSFWLFSIPITGEMPPERFLELARYPLEKMQPAIQAYWQAYVRQMGLDAATADRWLLRAVQFAAARLIQTAFEHMQTSMQFTGNIVCLLQLSLNILQRPREAIVQLLGIQLQGMRLP